MIWLIAWVLCLSLSTLSLSSDHLEIDSEDGGRKLFDSGQIRSFHFTTNGEYCTNPLTANKYPFSCKNQKRVLVIPQNFPVPTLHGSDKRCFHVLESLRALNHYVGLIPFSRASVKPGDDDKSLLIMTISVKELKLKLSLGANPNIADTYGCPLLISVIYNLCYIVNNSNFLNIV